MLLVSPNVGPLGCFFSEASRGGMLESESYSVEVRQVRGLDQFFCYVALSYRRLSLGAEQVNLIWVVLTPIMPTLFCGHVGPLGTYPGCFGTNVLQS